MVEVELRAHIKLLVLSFYRRPGGTNTDHLEVLDTSLKTLHSQYKNEQMPISMGGDYNLPNIEWDNSRIVGISARKPLCYTSTHQNRR